MPAHTYSRSNGRTKTYSHAGVGLDPALQAERGPRLLSDSEYSDACRRLIGAPGGPPAGQNLAEWLDAQPGCPRIDWFSEALHPQKRREASAQRRQFAARLAPFAAVEFATN